MHTINHNILHKIIDIMARNKWINNMIKINTQYLSKSIYIHNIFYDKCICKKCNKIYYIVYNHRMTCPFIENNNIYMKCYMYYIPKNYWYTSGLNHPFAYKKIE